MSDKINIARGDGSINYDNLEKDESPENCPISNTVPQLYLKRWAILTMFALLSFSNAYQWINLSIVSDRVAFVWNNSLPTMKTDKQIAISWLSMVYMLAYVPLIIPAMWFLEHKGLKSTTIIACFLNGLGCWLRCFSLSLDGNRFLLLMFSQTLCAISQIFILGIPAHLAAVWFGANEVSTATSLGVFGNNLGIGVGFAVPSYVIPPITNSTSLELLIYRFNILFYAAAILNTVLFLFICIFFQSKPKTPPSWGQILISQKPQMINYKKSLVELWKDVDFIMLVLTYGINAGCFYAISTALNEILILFFKEDSSLIGTTGLVLIISGVVAASFIGVVLDKTKEYKKIVLATYLCSVISLISFIGGLYLYSWPVVFITVILLGFFMTGYLPIGFEIAAEITYPANEGLTSGLLNLCAQCFGIIFTYTVTILLKHYSVILATSVLYVSLFAGLIITIITKIDQKRQKAHHLGAEIEVFNDDDTEVENVISVNSPAK